jgi:hypothetical protein
MSDLAYCLICRRQMLTESGMVCGQCGEKNGRHVMARNRRLGLVGRWLRRRELARMALVERCGWLRDVPDWRLRTWFC